MVKKEKGIEAIEYADSLLKETLKKYNEYCSRKSFLSEKDSIFEKNGLATQLAFICEIYLKGLLLPHLQINIPDEIKEKIGTLSEEEEYMIIVADDEKIRRWNNSKQLTKRELRILGQSSIKELGHSLFSLIGSKFESTDNATKKPPIYLDKNVRQSIINGMKEYIKNKKDIDNFEEYFKMLLEMEKSLDGMPYGKIKYDENIENAILDPTVGDAFVRSRFGNFDGYVADTDFLVKLALSIRKSIDYEYNNVIDIVEKNDSSELQIGRLIFPDSGSKIYIDDNGDRKVDRIYMLEPELRDNPSEPTMGIKEKVKLVRGKNIYSNEQDSIRKSLQENPEIFGENTPKILQGIEDSGSGKIYYTSNNGRVSICYTHNGKKINLILRDNRLIENGRTSDSDFEK